MGKQSPDIGNLFPHFTEYIYYAIALYRYLCNKHAIGSSSGNQTIASF